VLLLCVVEVECGFGDCGRGTSCLNDPCESGVREVGVYVEGRLLLPCVICRVVLCDQFSER
jgi:hypothetical protein